MTQWPLPRLELREKIHSDDGEDVRPGEEVLDDEPVDTGRSFVVLWNRKPSQPLASVWLWLWLWLWWI